MSNRIILNHHSLPFSCKEDADTGLLIFFKVLKSCRRDGIKILLVDENQDKSLMGLELANGYCVRNWFSSAKNNSALADWCRFLKTLETKQPLFESLDKEIIPIDIEVGMLGETTGKSVLLASYHLNIFLASFTALEAWLNNHIEVWVLALPALEERNERLLNLSTCDSLVVHDEELTRRRNALINTAKDIWIQRTELFPHITLLSNQIGNILQGWSARSDILAKARDALRVLDLFCEKWQAGHYVEYRHEFLNCLGLAAEVSGESKSVSEDPKKRKERMFWLEDAQHVYCENHVKLPSGYRMHFYVDSEHKRIYVAYLGPHLTL